jgi:glutamine amidotransferase-like uncharacterized protein
MKKIDKAYLLVAGALLPAYAAVQLTNILSKQPVKKNTSMLIFVGGALLGAYYTSKLINIKISKPFSVE